MPAPLSSLTIDQVLATELRYLGVIVLADMKARGEWRVRTYVGLAAQDLGGDDRARLVLQETISWLLVEGHLSHDWMSRNEGSVFVTRIGEGWLTLHP